MISEREILDAIENKLENLEIFQSVRRPENVISDHEQTQCVAFADRGEILIMLDDVEKLILGNEFSAWNLRLTVKILDY